MSVNSCFALSFTRLNNKETAKYLKKEPLICKFFYQFKNDLVILALQPGGKLTRAHGGQSALAAAEIHTATSLIQYQLFIELPTEQPRTVGKLAGRVGETISPEWAVGVAEYKQKRERSVHHEHVLVSRKSLHFQRKAVSG